MPAAELPALVAGHDVCLGIFGSAAKAARVVPNKVFQGAAAGCALVTSDTPPQRRVLDGAAVLVPPGDPPRPGRRAARAGRRPRPAGRRPGPPPGRWPPSAFTPDAVVRPLDERLRSLVPPEVHP